MVNYYLYRIGQSLALALPLKVAYWLATSVSDLRYLFAYQDRKIVTENLRSIFDTKSEEEIAKIRIHLFRNFAKYLVDFFRFEKINHDYIKKYVKIENSCYLDEARDAGKGAILVTAHLGNWELGGVVIALSGYPLAAVALPHKDKKVNKFFNSQRQSRGLRVIPLGNAARESLEVLKNKQFLALVGDRNFNEAGVVTDFFGKDSSFPQGPAVFSLRTGAKIIPGFMIRNYDDTFTLRLEKPLEVLETNDKAKDIRNIINQYVAIFEDYIRKYPDQWYMFRRFWQA
jgi:lauroyl/myristoyl acyltransferase